MNICLINPPSPFLIDPKVFVSIGILRVASSLEQNGYDVKVLDLAGITNWQEEIDNNISKYEVIGISSTTPQIPIVTEICNYIKNKFKKKKKKIILGGPHATMINTAYKMENPNIRAIVEIERLKNIFDVIVSGDGEFAILKAINSNEKILDSELDETLYLTNERYNQLTLPARHLIDMDSYHYQIDGVKATNLICQMGCPFSCSFCGGRNSKTFKRIRTRNLTSIMKEIDFLYKTYGYKGFMFYDDELNVNKYYFMEFLEELILYQYLNNVHFKLRGFTRADLLTAEQASKMYQAGFRWILTGFESGSDRMLINMNKGNTVKDNTNALEMARQAGLKVKALMSIGHPGESIDTINETKDWLLKVRPDETDITIISTYPGTPYYDETIWNEEKNAWQYTNKKTGDKLYSLNVDYMKDSVFYKSDPNSYKAFVFTDYLNCQELVDERKKLDILIKRRL